MEIKSEDAIVGAALRGRPIGGTNMGESDRVATEGHPYSCTGNVTVSRGG